MAVSEYVEYLGHLRDIEGIFSELEGIINVNKYKRRVSEVKRDVDNTKKTKVFPVNYQLQNRILIEIIDECRREYFDLRNIHNMAKVLKDSISDFSENNQDEMISKARELIDKLIDYLSKIKDDSADSVLNTIDSDIEVLYSALLHEAVIEKSGLLDYILDQNNIYIKETLGGLIRSDITSKLSETKMAEYRKKYAADGPGIDYLKSDVLRDLAEVVLKNERERFIANRANATTAILEYRDKLKSEKGEINLEPEDVQISNLRTAQRKAFLKLATYILIPIIGLSGSIFLGTRINATIGNKHTRTRDSRTGKVIEDTVDVIPSSVDKKYTAVIRIGGAWQLKRGAFGNKYVREVLEYEYTSDDVIEDLDISEIKKIMDMRNIKRTEEEKSELEYGDSMYMPEITVSEYTYENIRDSRLFPGAIIGIIGFVIMCLDYELIRSQKKEIEFGSTWGEFKNVIKEYSDVVVKKQTFLREREQIGDDIVTFETMIQEETGKYGDYITEQLGHTYAKSNNN